MASKWIQHVMAFAKANKMSYGAALADPRTRASYYAKK